MRCLTGSLAIRGGFCRRRILAVLGALLIAPVARAMHLLPRPQAAFRAETLSATLRELYGDQDIAFSDKIRISAAALAENGAVVPIKIEAEFEGLRAISIIASKNPVPLVAKFAFAGNVAGSIATRIKLAESCEVIAVAETDTGCFQARKAIEVTIGGCGLA